MENLTKLKEQVKVLFESATDKDTISKLTSINDTIAAVEADTKALQDEQKELLKDYKDIIKHASFDKTGDADRGAQTQTGKSFEQVLAEFKAKK